MKKEDLRIIKTKKALYDALLYLIKRNNFENIKVFDICNKANINRSTFYDHFSDKYELLNNFFNDIQNDFVLNNYDIDKFNNIKEYFLKIVKELLKHFKINFDIYSSIIKYDNFNVSFDILTKTISNNFDYIITKLNYHDDIPRDIVISYYVPAIISVCKEFLFYPNLYSESDIISYVDKLILI